MDKIGAQFKLLEPLPAFLLAGSSAPGACPSCKELTLRDFDVQLETGLRQPFQRGVPEYKIDEALWAAYRRQDKRAALCSGLKGPG